MVYLQRWHGWCHMKLLPSRRTFCEHTTTSAYTMHKITEALYSKPHTSVLNCNLAATCILGRMTGIFYVLLRQHRVGTDTEIGLSTENLPWKRIFSYRSCRDSNPRPFNHESGALTTELSPPPLTLNCFCLLFRTA